MANTAKQALVDLKNKPAIEEKKSGELPVEGSHIKKEDERDEKGRLVLKNEHLHNMAGNMYAIGKNQAIHQHMLNAIMQKLAEHDALHKASAAQHKISEDRHGMNETALAKLIMSQPGQSPEQKAEPNKEEK